MTPNTLWRGALLVAIAATAPVFAATLPTSAPEKVGLSSERLARMDKAIHAKVDSGRIPGVVVVVARHGRVVHVDAYGAADVATGRRTNKDDLFRLYSMTKPITTVALLMLYEEGKFQLTDPLSKYFPAFADVKVYSGTSPQGGMLLDSPKRHILVHDVFRHTAGFTYGLFSGTPVDQLYQKANVFETNLDDLMVKLAKLPLMYQPGERWLYSVSHDVQAALVEKLSGMKFDEFVRQRIFTPLGM
jgi:CubicO group peptidase (beta-lactamase class C family)